MFSFQHQLKFLSFLPTQVYFKILSRLHVQCVQANLLFPECGVVLRTLFIFKIRFLFGLLTHFIHVVKLGRKVYSVNSSKGKKVMNNDQMWDKWSSPFASSIRFVSNIYFKKFIIFIFMKLNDLTSLLQWLTDMTLVI